MGGDAEDGVGARGDMKRGAREIDSIDIGVCTFRRSLLAQTLRSLDRLDLPPGYRVSILVADNDDAPTAQPLVAALADEIGLPVRYHHCPARNISLARNTCLEHSDARFMAFIDDDEEAAGNWLGELLNVMEAEKADVVLGPVRAEYGDEAPDWMRRGDFHSTFPVVVKGAIRTGYTCNVLLRMASPAISTRRFSLAKGRSGGEDTEFFHAVHRAGGKIAYASEAWVHEAVPADRASLSWLASRRFRSGQTHGHLLAERAHGLKRVLEVGVALSKVAYCTVLAAALAPMPIRRNRNLLRAALHAGTISGLVGMRELQLYDASRKLDAHERSATRSG